MEFDDILYFLFLAGWVILGALRKRNKNKEKAPRRRPSYEEKASKPVKSFSDIVTELSYQAEQSRAKVYEPTVQEEISDDYQEISPSDTETEIIEEAKPAFGKFDKSLSKDESHPRSSESELLKDFDLRKAVIYETILNRKYF